MSYTIGQIAELIHESTYTLRYYSKEGLLPFEKRNEHGIRVFEKEDLELFNVIKCLKATHMPIKEIKKFVQLYMEGDSTIAERRKMFEERKAVVAEELKNTKNLYDDVSYRCWFFEQAEKAGTIDVKYSIKLEDVPKHLRKFKKNFDAVHLHSPSEEENEK